MWYIKRNFVLGFNLILGLVPMGWSQDASHIEYRDPSIAILQEIGMIQSGLYETFFTDDWIDHFGAFWTQEAWVDNRLQLKIGLGGTFQFPKPEKYGAGWIGNGNSLTKFFFIGPTEATFTYHIGSQGGEEGAHTKLGLGMFPYKYNRDAANLGEYLFRSNPYPNYIMTGGYTYINSAAAYLQGAKAEWEWKGFSAAALLLTETTIAPLYDASLAFLFNYKLPSGLLDVGFGVNFKRMLPAKAERTQPEETKNAYITMGSEIYSLNRSYYTSQALYWRNSARDNQQIGDSLTALGQSNEASLYYAQVQSDSSVLMVLESQATVVRTYLDTVSALEGVVSDPNSTPQEVVAAEAELSALPQPDYYTASGTILMAKLAIDIKSLFNSPWLGENDLRIYTEAALLGVKDYPIFYNNRLERLPVMLGVNLPAFKLLDLLAVQFEYYNSPYLNSNLTVYTDAIPLPYFPSGGDSKFSRNAYFDITDQDNWTWSVLAKKSVYKNISFSAQFARDHLRAVSANIWAGPKLEAHENLIRKKDWYWAVQMMIGI